MTPLTDFNARLPLFVLIVLPDVCVMLPEPVDCRVNTLLVPVPVAVKEIFPIKLMAPVVVSIALAAAPLVGLPLPPLVLIVKPDEPTVIELDPVICTGPAFPPAPETRLIPPDVLIDNPLSGADTVRFTAPPAPPLVFPTVPAALTCPDSALVFVSVRKMLPAEFPLVPPPFVVTVIDPAFVTNGVPDTPTLPPFAIPPGVVLILSAGVMMFGPDD